MSKLKVSDLEVGPFILGCSLDVQQIGDNIPPEEIVDSLVKNNGFDKSEAKEMVDDAVKASKKLKCKVSELATVEDARNEVWRFIETVPTYEGDWATYLKISDAKKLFDFEYEVEEW